MSHERIIWWFVLGLLCVLLILTVAIGAGPVNAAFEALTILAICAAIVAPAVLGAVL